MRKGRDGKRKEKKKKEKNGVFSGHYVVASSLPPERLSIYISMYLSKLIYKTLKAICCHQSNFKGTEKLTNTVKNTENLKNLENT